VDQLTGKATRCIVVKSSTISRETAAADMSASLQTATLPLLDEYYTQLHHLDTTHSEQSAAAPASSAPSSLNPFALDEEEADDAEEAPRTSKRDSAAFKAAAQFGPPGQSSLARRASLGPI